MVRAIQGVLRPGYGRGVPHNSKFDTLVLLCGQFSPKVYFRREKTREKWLPDSTPPKLLKLERQGCKTADQLSSVRPFELGLEVPFPPQPLLTYGAHCLLGSLGQALAESSTGWGGFHTWMNGHIRLQKKFAAVTIQNFQRLPTRIN